MERKLQTKQSIIVLQYYSTKTSMQNCCTGSQLIVYDRCDAVFLNQKQGGNLYIAVQHIIRLSLSLSLVLFLFLCSLHVSSRLVSSLSLKFGAYVSLLYRRAVPNTYKRSSCYYRNISSSCIYNMDVNQLEIYSKRYIIQ